MKFYFKVNNKKLRDENKLKHQIELVTNYLVKKYNINYTRIELMFGTAGIDIIHNQFRLKINFN